MYYMFWTIDVSLQGVDLRPCLGILKQTGKSYSFQQSDNLTLFPNVRFIYFSGFKVRIFFLN